MDRVLCFLIYFIAAFSGLSKLFGKTAAGRYEEYRQGGRLKILLVGYNGARNTGSDVRVAAIARQAAELFGKENVHITVLTMDVSSLSGYFDEDVELLPISSFFPFDLYSACCTHHAAILCEGSTLKSTFANALTLFMCEAAGIMTRQKKPCLAYGSEIGEMEPFLAAAAKRLCRGTYFITRTEASLAGLKKLGLKGHAGTDAAWCYDRAIAPKQARQLLCAQGWDGKKPLLGIAVINPFCWPVRASLTKWIWGHLTGNLQGQYDRWYFFSDSPERREAYKTYIREVAAGVNAFLKENDCFPVILGMERLDAKACGALREQLDVSGAVFLSGETPAAVMTGVLRELSVLVTSRYHAAVLSMEEGCPCVAVSMDERLDGIMRELDLDRTYLLRVDEENLGDRLYGALSKAAADQQRIRSHIKASTAAYKQTLQDMGDFLKSYIQQSLKM